MNRGLRTILAWSLAGLALAPLLVLLRGSLVPTEPGKWSALLASGRLWHAVANSALLASIQTLAGLALASAAGYALAAERAGGAARSGRALRGQSAGKGWWVTATMVAIVGLAALPPQLLLPGGFELAGALGLFDTRWAVVVPGALNLFGVLLYRSAFLELPGDVLQAARVDGAGEWRVWWAVALPMVRPTTSALMVLSFAGAWNAVVWPMLVLQRPALETLPIRLATLSGTALTPQDHAVVMAVTLLGIVPVLLLFLLLQRDFLPTLKGAVRD